MWSLVCTWIEKAGSGKCPFSVLKKEVGSKSTFFTQFRFISSDVKGSLYQPMTSRDPDGHVPLDQQIFEASYLDNRAR